MVCRALGVCAGVGLWAVFGEYGYRAAAVRLCVWAEALMFLERVYDESCAGACVFAAGRCFRYGR